MVLKEKVDMKEHIFNKIAKIINRKFNKVEEIPLYENVFKGYYLNNINRTEYDLIKKHNDVEIIERDKIVKISFVNHHRRTYLQSNSTWNLHRLISKNRIFHFLNGKFNNHHYYYNEMAGKDVDVYIMDSGVKVDHNDFENRAFHGKNFCLNSPSIEDKDGHGTHVAGIVAGSKYGVAKKANIIAVKVIEDDGYGYNSQLLRGIDWAYRRTKVKNKKGVVNLSLGSELSEVVNEAIKKASDRLLFVVSAGNENDDSCLYSPASSTHAITVASSDVRDQISEFSNFGKCVNIYAPGEDILSDCIGPTSDDTAVYSGTSMASPHVAGLAAYIMSSMDYFDDLNVVKMTIRYMAMEGRIRKNPTDTPNLLAYKWF